MGRKFGVLKEDPPHDPKDDIVECKACGRKDHVDNMQPYDDDEGYHCIDDCYVAGLEE